MGFLQEKSRTELSDVHKLFRFTCSKDELAYKFTMMEERNSHVASVNMKTHSKRFAASLAREKGVEVMRVFTL